MMIRPEPATKLVAPVCGFQTAGKLVGNEVFSEEKELVPTGSETPLTTALRKRFVWWRYIFPPFSTRYAFVFLMSYVVSTAPLVRTNMWFVPRAFGPVPRSVPATTFQVP